MDFYNVLLTILLDSLFLLSDIMEITILILHVIVLQFQMNIPCP